MYNLESMEARVKSSTLNLSEIRYIEIGKIDSIHPDITRMFDQSGGDLPVGYQPQFEQTALIDALTLSPITIQKHNIYTYCIGGISSYRVACAQLSLRTVIPVRYFEGRRGDKFDRLLAAELLSNQLILSKPRTPFMHRWLYAVWLQIRLRNKKYNILRVTANKSDFSKSLGIDRRGMNDKK
jgi:hypothetical protein